MKAYLLALALAAALCGSARAHDFWLDLGEHYDMAPDGERAGRFLVGHAGDSELWLVRPERVVSFRNYGPDGVADLHTSLTYPAPDRPGGAAISLAQQGSNLVAFETTPADIELEPAAFNEYINLEGLTPAIERRKAIGEEDRPGRELYSRRTKTIVQVGEALTDNVTRRIGQTLEIVPEKNPLALAADEPLTVRLYYYGEPLAAAMVHLESLSAGLIPEITHKTDADGRAVFSFPHRGAWKFDVIWTRPIEGNPRADFATTFSSLTFGY